MTKIMKKSGLEWIGDIPQCWTRSKIKNVCSTIGSGTTPDSHILDYYDGGVFWIQSGDIYGKTEIAETSVSVTPLALRAFSALKVYRAPFVTMAMYGGSVGNLAISNIDACTNQACCCMKPNGDVLIRFLYYWLDFCKQDFLVKAEGGGQPNISQNKIKNQVIFFPSIDEQKKIIEILDSKCAEIDALATDVHSEIEMLESYKRSIIKETVTKGLDNNASMKDSGIEWVGEIPETWDVHPLYVYFKERKNKNFALQEQNLLSLSYGKIIRKDIETVGGLLPASFNTYNIVEVGDIIIRPTDLQNDKRSLRTGLVTERGIITSAYIDLAPKANANSAYFHYLLHTFDVQKVFYNMGNGVRQGLNYNEFSKLMVFAPPRSIQDAIVNYLDDMCVEIEAIISQKRAQLSILSELKKSITYEYITGKKEASIA